MGRRWALAACAAAAIALWPAWLSMSSAPAPAGPPANLDFTLKDMHGKDVRLSDFRGRPLIINFWATWCGPCKAEIPALVELTRKYEAEGLTVLGISVDDMPDELLRFAGDYKMNYPVLVGRGQDKLQETYDAMLMVPVTWFIRPDGTIHRKHQGPATHEWFEEQVREMIDTSTGAQP